MNKKTNVSMKPCVFVLTGVSVANGRERSENPRTGWRTPTVREVCDGGTNSDCLQNHNSINMRSGVQPLRQMARTHQTMVPSRKRKFNGSSKKTFKRRKVARRGRKTSSFSTRSFGGAGLTYRSKKLSGRRYRNMLYTTTQMKAHYRSLLTSTSTLVTPANQVQKQTAVYSARASAAADPFMSVLGGALDPLGTGAIPGFSGSVILRGGVIRLQLTNVVDAAVAAQVTVGVDVSLVKTTVNFSASGSPALVPLLWDPTYVPDFQTSVGRVLLRKTLLLKDGDVMDLDYRVPVQKVDITQEAQNRNTYMWFVQAYNVDTAVAQTVRVTTSHNLSFAGDAI